MLRRLPVAALFAICLQAAAEQPQPLIRLWPDGTPGAVKPPIELTIVERGDPERLRDRYARFVTDPNLVVFPAASPNGQALLIIPGGGYQRVVMDKEGYEAAEWFSKRGITAFVLMYRLPGDGWRQRADVPLQDAQRAMRLIRQQAEAYGYSTNRIGVLGFSAGGHVAASLATSFDRPTYEPADKADAMSARPNFAVLLYPVVSMDPAIAHAGSRQELLGPEPGAAAVEASSVERQAGRSTPPVFLLHAADDTAVDLRNSLRLFDALRAAEVSVDLHVFSEGGHGFGLRYATDKPVFEWPELALRWMAEH